MSTKTKERERAKRIFENRLRCVKKLVKKIWKTEQIVVKILKYEDSKNVLTYIHRIQMYIHMYVVCTCLCTYLCISTNHEHLLYVRVWMNVFPYVINISRGLVFRSYWRLHFFWFKVTIAKTFGSVCTVWIDRFLRKCCKRNVDPCHQSKICRNTFCRRYKKE